MRRVLLDTSVYGKLIEDEETIKLISKKVPSEFVIYGLKIVRDELRKTSTTVKFAGRNKRILLLTLYDSFIRKDHHDLKLNKLVTTLAEDYFKAYHKLGGGHSLSDFENDLIIIATGTIYQLDIIVSNDLATMLLPQMLKVYNTVNQSYGLKNPVFKSYETFKKELRGPA